MFSVMIANRLATVGRKKGKENKSGHSAVLFQSYVSRLIDPTFYGPSQMKTQAEPRSENASVSRNERISSYSLLFGLRYYFYDIFFSHMFDCGNTDCIS